MKKIVKIILWSIAGVIITVVVYFGTTFPPIMAGMAAKTMCSCVYVAGRSVESVTQKELQVFPGMDKLTFVFGKDSSVTTSVLFSTKKAIYRKGLGCTLLAQRSEEEVRNQKINLATPPQVNQDTIAWPFGNKVNTDKVDGVDYEKVNAAIEEAFADIDPKNPIFTHAVIVVYDGKLIAEKYADGFNYNTPQMGWSMTKSVTNSMVGMLVKEGKLNIDKPAPVEEWKGDERIKITLNDLLHASSGLEWNESYFLPGDFHNMFIHSDDKGGYAASKKLAHEPNTFFYYSSGTSNLLSKIVRQTIGDDGYYKFAFENLFYKIGMLHTTLEPDASGTYVGSSYCFASARDWARFGLLFLNDGISNGERILPEGWVKYSHTPAPAATLGEYGAQWWLNAGAKGNPAESKYKGMPNEAAVADGFEGQSVVLIPSKKLVVVRLGVTHNENFSISKLVKKVVEAVK
jgi:CubicO group peptidase (beta-lactamase class C family)